MTEKCYVDTVRSTKLSMPHFYPKNRVHWRIKLILFFPYIFADFAHALIDSHASILILFIYLMVLKEENTFILSTSKKCMSKHYGFYEKLSRGIHFNVFNQSSEYEKILIIIA